MDCMSRFIETFLIDLSNAKKSVNTDARAYLAGLLIYKLIPVTYNKME